MRTFPLYNTVAQQIGAVSLQVDARTPPPVYVHIEGNLFERYGRGGDYSYYIIEPELITHVTDNTYYHIWSEEE